MTTHASPEDTTADAREELYTLMNDRDQPLEERQRRALEIGLDHLDLDNGHIERVRADGDTHEVTVSVGATTDDVYEGAVIERATTYCRRTVERDSPLALSDAPNQGWGDHPAYAKHRFDCYLGATIYVEGDTYGTVCFVSRDAHPEPFGTSERLFIELLARLLGRAIEADRHRDAMARERQARDRSDAKYATLLDAVPAALFVIDQSSGEVVEVNERASELLGCDEAAIVGREYPDFLPARQRDRYRENPDVLLEADGDIESFGDGASLAVTRPDGTEIPVEISADAVVIDGTQYVQALVRDISARRAREAELRVKDRAMDEASVGITIADATEDDLPLVYANDAFEALTGYDADEVIGRNCRFLQGPETSDDAVAAIRGAVRAGESITTELVNYTAAGRPFWNELTVAPVTGDDGDVTHFVGIQRDVTGRKRRERLNQVMNRVLRHNLRNDMNAVKGFADLLADRLDGEAASYADRIVSTASDLTALSEKAQTIERTVKETDPPRERDAAVVLHRVADRLRDEASNADIRVRVDDEVPVMATDRLVDALLELGRNAIEHGGDDPSVTLSADSTGDDSTAITVRDDGPGLPEHERAPLETGRETPLEHGSGLGLWMVNWIVTGTGGTVDTEPDGEGAVITLRLPARPGARVEPPTPTEPRLAGHL